MTAGNGAGKGRALRIAFLTPEFLTEDHASGGIANYVAKIATALRARGVETEVFVPSRTPGVVNFDGIRVERVPRETSWLARGISRALRPVAGSRAELVLHLMDARRLARALDRRHRERPFDCVQSSNHRLSGFFVPNVRGRRTVIRISTSRRLYDEASGLRNGTFSKLTEWLDVRVIRRADVAYAPSSLLANHFNTTYGTDVRVLRPPAELGATPAEHLPFTLPERFLFHFGSLGVRKGTETVARALTTAWKVDPSLRMVWAGPIHAERLAAFRTAWGASRERVTVLGPLAKSTLYGVLKRSLASVLPSTVDNLPNTVIESLALGIPVIGSNGASIDELVEHGRSGALVPIGDVDALAESMLEAWQGRAPWLGAGFRAPASLQEMETGEAVRRLLVLMTGRSTST